MDFKGMRCEGVDLIHLTTNRDQLQTFLNTVMNLMVP
jgi:hypothetical protein